MKNKKTKKKLMKNSNKLPKGNLTKGNLPKGK